jgi:predicted ATPase
LGVEPTAETVALYERIRAGQGGSESATTAAVLVPPSLTPFVGRQAELADIAELLANPDCRLVTLVGLGGVGKTRLALQVATEQVGLFADGVAFVPLAAVETPDGIVPIIAEVLNLAFRGPQAPAQQLASYLRAREMLLVLDGMEHVLEGAGLLSALLKEAPGLRALVTSRERLALREEWVYPLEGLDYPAATPLPDEGERLLVYSAVELFYRRAAQAGQRFALEAATAPAVAHICRLAEGLPLAVELAASWATTHSCQEIARALEQNLDILTTMLRQVPERQRSVRAAFEYSWQMLAGPERDAFARLSIFRGGFGAEAAFQVSGAAPPTLLALLEKSPLRRDPAGRYAMHELLRQYAEEKLHAEPAAREETRSRYVRHMASFLARQGEHLNDRQQKGALEEIGREIENVHHAWNLAVASGSEQEGKEKAGRLAQELDLSLPDSPPRPLEAVVAEVMALSAGREVEGGQQA